MGWLHANNKQQWKDGESVLVYDITEHCCFVGDSEPNFARSRELGGLYLIVEIYWAMPTTVRYSDIFRGDHAITVIIIEGRSIAS